MEKNYLRKLGVFNCIIDAVKKDEYKGKESVVLVFKEVYTGALIDAKFRLPMNEYDQKAVKNILEITGKTKISEVVGGNLAVLVAPALWKGKTYWNPRNYWNVKYLGGDNNLDLDGIAQSIEESYDKIEF